MNSTKGLVLVASVLVSVVLSACGGGGGGGGSAPATNSSTGTSPTSPTSTTPTTPPPSLAANQVPLVAESGPGNAFNRAFVSVTVCIPGTTTCQTVDHVIVDTASTGLRLYASVLNSSMLAGLPASTDSNGAPTAECAMFAGGNLWGSVRKADVKMAGEVASALPVQVIADPAYTEPSGCTSTGTSITTPAGIGGNGLIGLSSYRQDYGAGVTGPYYACSGSTCTVEPSTVTLAQVSNPVASFPQDYNGTIITLPAVPASGASQAAGTLTFGLDTQADNSATNVGGKYYNVAPSSGALTTTYKGTAYPSFLDTGSGAYYFSDSSLPSCSLATGMFCPNPAVSLSATIAAPNGSTSTIPFNIGDADTLLTTGTAYVYSNIGANAGSNALISGNFDWGLPFYFGRSVATVLNGAAYSGGVGPGVQF